MEPVSPSYTQTEIVLPGASNSPPILRLRLEKKNSPKRVAFSNGTVDNENMNKKKSKCCCIYKKPLEFGESSSSSDEDCEHCFGHPEKRKKKCKQPGCVVALNVEKADETEIQM